MAQEAFLRAYRSLAKWRREGVFSTWLFALATNLYRAGNSISLAMDWSVMALLVSLAAMWLSMRIASAKN